MNKPLILQTTTDLKTFFENKKLTVSETKEVMFRLIDYIDEQYDEDERDKPFKNGNTINGNLFKDKISLKH